MALERFWEWYERHKTFNIGLAASLFLIQIVHLIWLFGEVVWLRLAGYSLFELTGIWQWIIILVDYTEIPALVSVSIVYINELRKRFSWKDLALLVFTNSQWLHLFWITDEFVVREFSESGALLPFWLAWVAILIDYLEVPVIIDTIKKFFVSIREERLSEFLQNDLKN